MHVRVTHRLIAYLFGTLALAVGLSVAAPALSEPGDAVRFPEADWDPILIEKSRRNVVVTGDRSPGIAPPPRNMSAQTVWEIRRLLYLQRTARGPDAVIEIMQENFLDLEDLLVRRKVMPPRGDAPDLWDLYDLGHADVVTLVLREKHRFQRARPTQLSDELHAIIPIPGHAAYPSGHATEMNFTARFLSRLAPACAADYRDIATRVARNREIAGVHYPSDSRAGARIAGWYAGLYAASRVWSRRSDAAASQLAAFVEAQGCPEPGL